MGQKINPLIFRMNLLKNDWKLKYFEKSLEEFSLYSFQSIEIKKYLNQFLNNIGLMLHDYKIYYNNKFLHLYISYFLTSKIIPKIPVIKRKILKVKTKLNSFPQISVFSRKKTEVHKKYEKFLQIQKFKYQKIIKLNNFLEQMLESLSLFLTKKLNIIIIFQQVQKGLSLNFNNLTKLDKKIIKNKFLLFRKYLKDPSFKDLLHTLILTVKLKNSANLLSNYISTKLSKTKRQNQFYYLLKHILVILQKTKVSEIKGIKIKIKGRFNGKPRSSSKYIIIGEIPVQTISKKIDFFESTSFTLNGTFGVKVWINQR